MNLRSIGFRLGVFLVLIASSSGLGNLWRFPYVVSENGGGGFVWLYLFFAMVVGTPILIGELLLGKMTGKSLLSSVADMRPSKFDSVWTNFSVVLCLMILGYFSVISSWVLLFFVKYLVSLMSGEVLIASKVIGELINNGWLQFLLTAFHMSLLITVISQDIEGGVERFVGYLMPLFAVFLCLMVFKSLSLESAEQAVRFLFYPNFSDLTWSSLSSAMGQVLFTLSLGFTSMITLGSRLPKDSTVTDKSFGIAFIDSMISLLAGLLVFPLIFSFHTQISGSPLLLFETVPVFFETQVNGSLLGTIFFFALYLGAFGASISLIETVVVNLNEHHEYDRTTASILAGGLSLFMAVLPILAISNFSSIKIKGKSLLMFWDHLLINWLLPIVALILSQWVYYKISHEKKEEFFKTEEGIHDQLLFKQWMFMIRWVVPITILLCFVLSLVGIFLKLNQN